MHNLCVMLPVVVLLFLASDMILGRLGEREWTLSLFLYWGPALLMLVGIYWTYRISYRKVYISAYRESADTRIKLAEKIRQLPLSYFGRRNLSDLSSTMMNDMATVELALSGVSDLCGGILSSLVILLVLFFFDWRMSLGLFICLPVSLFFLFRNVRLSPAINLNSRRAKLGLCFSCFFFSLQRPTIHSPLSWLYSARLSYRFNRKDKRLKNGLNRN